MISPKRRVWFWLSLLVVVVDQVTKWAVIENLSLYQRIPILSILDLVRLHNTGAAFSFLANASRIGRISSVLAPRPGMGVMSKSLWGPKRRADLFDFDGFPKIQKWLAEMERLPFHEPAHRYNLVLGDIRTKPNTMKRFLEASIAGVAALGGDARP